MSRGPHNPPQVVYVGDPPPTNPVGVVGFVFSILGFLTCGVVSPLGLLVSLIGLSRSPRGFATAGTLTGLIGTVWLATIGYAMVMGVVFARSAVESTVQTIATSAALEKGKLAIESYRQEHGGLPDGIEGNKLVLDLEDGWQHGIRYALQEDGSYVLRSAGPDGEFHTDDDLKSDMDYAGIRIDSSEGEVLIGPGGIEVESDGDRVRVGVGGIQIDSGDEEVSIDGNGIRVEDGDQRIEITPGQLRGEAGNGSTGVQVEDGGKAVGFDLPVSPPANEPRDG